MLVVQLGSSIACTQTALLLRRFGARVIQFGSEDRQGSGAEAVLRQALAFGADRVTADSVPDRELLHLILDRADTVLDDRPFSFWLKHDLNLRRRYLSHPPHANWCGITPYGLFGIGEDWRGCELTQQASGPFMIRLGEAGRHPVVMKGPQTEIAAAWHAALLVAASEQGRGPTGALLDISLQEIQFMQSEIGASNWHFNHLEIGRLSQGQRSSVFPALDGDVHLLFHDREWPRIARMIGRPDLERDERFMARHQRMQHLEEVDELLVPWFLERTRREAVEAGQDAGVPLAFAQTPEEVLADPQLAHRQAFERLSIAGRTIVFPISLATFSGQPGPARRSTDAGRDLDLDEFADELRDHPASVPAREAISHDPQKPLTGVRILDLTNTWAGPRGVTLLGDLGAEVVKLEGLEWMDMLRGFTAPPPFSLAYPRGVPGEAPWDRYVMWLGMARNKKSVAIELTRPEGRAMLDELIGLVDIVVTNMSPGTRAKHGLVYDQLVAKNPRVIFATLSAYGDGGPRSDWRLFGDGQAAMAGLFLGSGYEGEGSVTFGAYGDPVNGTALAYQIVQALRRRDATGQGAHVDVSAVETCLNYNIRSLVQAQLGEAATEPVGWEPQGRYPHGLFRCLGEDRWIAISCADDAERHSLIDGLGALGFALPDAVKRGEATAEDWHEALAAICRDREPEPIEHELRNRGIPCQHVIRARDVDSDPVLSSRRFLSWLWREDLGTYPVFSPMWLINGERPAITKDPARFGEDNDEVLERLLHRSADDRDRLRRAGVIGEKPLVGAELGIRPGQ